LGGIIGSALGGLLAKPADFFPGVFPKDGLFGRYPYLLPNLASVVVIVIAILQGIIFLEETNPRARGEIAITTNDEDDVEDETTPLTQQISKSSSIRISSDESRPLFMEESLPVPSGPGFDLRRGSFGTMRSVDVPAARPRLETIPSESNILDPNKYEGPIWNRTIIMLVIALVLFSYHQMAFGALLPIHLLDPARRPRGQLDFIGGLGYTLHDVSLYLSVNGVCSLFIQAFVFPLFVKRVGVWYSFVTMIILYPTAYLFMPFLSAVPNLTSAGIYLSLILQAFYGIILNPSALILLKDATPSSLMLGRVNGLAMSACCIARTISPPLAGFIYDAGGSAAAWFSCACVALVGVVQLFWVPRKHERNVSA
jgi:hypothetical protein